MKVKSIFYLLASIAILISCERKVGDKEDERKQLPKEEKVRDSSSSPNTEEALDYCGFLDSMISLKFDTSTLEGKAKTVVNSYNLKHWEDLFQSTKDSLLDLNYDGFEDLLIYYNRPAGTGLKIGVTIYFFNPLTNNFNDTSSISFENPSFYLSEKKISEFYIALGGGYGSLYNWRNGKREVVKELNFYPSEETEARWKVEVIDNETNDTSYTFQENNFVIPSDSILRNDYN